MVCLLIRRLAFLIGLGGGTAAGYAHADVVVTQCDGSNQIGSGVNLAEALNVGGHITFACGQGNISLPIAATQVVTRTTEIDGGGRVTLDTRRAGQVFRTDGIGVFTLKNIRVTGVVVMPIGTAEPKISGSMSVVLDAVEFNTTARPVQIDRGFVTVRNSRFDGNAGPVLEAPNLTVIDSRFRGTHGVVFRAAGGKVDLRGVEVSGNGQSTISGISSFSNCELRISHSRFSAARSPTTMPPSFSFRAAAVRTNCPINDIEETIFADNAGADGALMIGPAALRTTLRRTNFTGNKGSERGGAVTIFGSDGAESSVRISASSFEENVGLKGGAIHVGRSQRPVELRTNLVGFVKNRARAGGAIWSMSTHVDLVRTFLLDNSAETGASAAFMTGASGTRPTRLVNTVVARNEGPAALAAVDVSLLNTDLTSNTGIGLVVDGEADLHNSVLANNIAGNCRQGDEITAYASVQFPSQSCGGGVISADPLLDEMFVPAPASPLRNAGDDVICRDDPVGGIDIYHNRRSRLGRCTIGAVEQDVESLVLGLDKTRKTFPYGVPATR